MLFQLWRLLELDAERRSLEVARAEGVGERILRTATTAPALLEHLEPASRFVVRDGSVVVDDEIGWLSPSAGKEDVVVADRLARAERAEFVERDPEAAERHFAALLQASLPGRERLVVLAAALWFHTRGNDEPARRAIAVELDERIEALALADLADPAVANAVAAAARQRRAGPPPAWHDRLVPRLPLEIAAGLPESAARPEAVAKVVARRHLLRRVADEWRARALEPTGGLVAVGDDALLWWVPAPDGSCHGAWTTIDEWLAAVRAAGREGALPEWPWLVEPDVVPAAGAAFAGVPHVRGLRATSAPMIDRHSWFLPALSLSLLASFGVAGWLQWRASRSREAAMRAQTEFLTTVTHELRTPLASIRLLGEMLAEGRAAGREQQYYAMLAGEAGRLSMLIENVLDLGRLERGERAHDPRSVDVAAVVQDTITLFAPVAALDAVTVAWRNDAPVPSLARIDRSAFVQALVCVLDNARKYGARGDTIDVTTTNQERTFVLQVRDHGSGVPVGERERIFERFVRGREHAHGGIPGVGIGLYLARTIVRRMGGDLVCVPPVDGGPGACFTFTLPMEDTA